MSARWAAPKAPAPTYTSGWCGTAQHSRCWGQYAGADCGCPCHQTQPEPTPAPEPERCGTCGQTLPPELADGAARLTALTAAIDPCPLDDP